MMLVLALKSRRVKEQLCATWAVAAVSHRRSISPARTPALQCALAATMLFVLLWAACGGGGGGGTTPPPTGTPAGTYNLTLTATAAGVNKTSSLTLKVN